MKEGRMTEVEDLQLLFNKVIQGLMSLTLPQDNLLVNIP